MKMPACLLLMVFASAAHADATSDAYNAGASYGKSNASQGTGTLKNPSEVTSAIPGYTSNPPEKSYYGGVQGGDGGLSDKGQTALGNSSAGQAVIDSGTKNPVPTIDPNAPYITIGKAAEAGAGSVLDGTSQQCTETSVSKSTFENYQCDRDVGSIETCGRTASITGSYVDNYTYPTYTIEFRQLTLYGGSQAIPLQGSGNGPYYYDVPVPAGDVISATLTYEFNKSSAYSNDNYYLNLTLLGQKLTLYDNSGSYNLPAGTSFSSGQTLRIAVSNKSNTASSIPGLFDRYYSSPMWHYTIVITFRQGSRKWVPQISWKSSCGFNTSTSLASAGSVCTDPGGTRTVTVDGVTYSQYSACWGYTDSYVVGSSSTGNCSSLINDPNCTLASHECTSTEAGTCMHQTETYQCQKVFTSTGLVCGGTYFCKTGDCSETDGAGDSGFDTAVAKLAGLASAAEDAKGDTMDIKAFTGQSMSCRKAFAGFSNCCKDSGWGSDAGLASCNSDEIALGKAKAKKITVDVGEKCDRQVLGVCVQKSKVYCVFTGKLARIIQEQGRRDQLHVSFGSGDSPNCRGITVPELQSINFDLINFADFYEDLMNNQKIPDSATMARQAKDRIAAQVAAQSGGK